MKQQRNFTCQTCNSDAMSFEEIRKHLAEVHQSDGKGTKQMISHIDGRDFYSTAYQWTFPDDVIVIESITKKREKDDPMRYQDGAQ